MTSNGSTQHMSGRLWVTWESQRRNHSLSRALHARLFVYDTSWPACIRYPLLAMRTAALILRERPEVLFVQNPSILLSYLATRYGRLSGTRVVVDAHNAGIHPFDGKKGWANFLRRKIIADAAVTIVSNDGLVADVLKDRGRPFVIPDPLPTFGEPEKVRLREGYNVLYICTWADDEPYREVIAAAAGLEDGVSIYVTGNYRKRLRDGDLPVRDNLVLTGFVRESEFVGLLHAADVIVDLTTRENCLVCGAYEAVAAGKPFIVSDTPALRGYFREAALYTDNTAADLRRVILQSRELHEQLRLRVKALADEKRGLMSGLVRRFEEKLAEPARQP